MENKDEYSVELTDRQWGIIYNILFIEPYKLAERDGEVGEITEKISAERKRARSHTETLPVNGPTGMKYQDVSNGMTATIHISTNNAIDLAGIIDVLNEKNISAKFE